MKNYRIKKVTKGNEVKYYPQRKIFGRFWVSAGYWSYDISIANNRIEEDKNMRLEPIIEYIEPDNNN